MILFRQRPWSSGVILIVSIILLVGGGTWWFTRLPGHRWDAGRRVGQIAFSPDGQLLASAETNMGNDAHPEIVLRHVPDGRVMITLRGQRSDIRMLAFSSNGRQIAAAGGNATTRVWAAADGRLITTLHDTTSTSDVYALAWRPDGSQIITVSRDGSARWWNVNDGRLLRTAQVVTNFDGNVAINSQRELVAYATVGRSGIWRAADAQITPLSNVFGNTLVFSADERMMAGSGCEHGYELCIWNVDTGRITAVFKGHTDGIQSIAFSPDGSLVASASGLNPQLGAGNAGDRTIRLWRIADGTALATLTVHSSYIYGLAFSPDGKYLASGSFDNRIGLWTVADMVGKQ